MSAVSVFNLPTLLASVLTDLEDDLPALIESSTDPDALDLAALYLTLLEAQQRLVSMVRDTEAALAREMVGDTADGHGLHVERRRTLDRKAWDHTSLASTVRKHVRRKHGALAGTQVLTAEGELLDVSIDALMADAQAMFGSSPPRVGALRALGIDPSEFCETSPGSTRVTVRRTQVEDGAA